MFYLIIQYFINYLEIPQYFHHIVEAEWAIELALEYDRPVAATMCMGPNGDGDGNSPGECAVRLAKAGAQLIGVNCLYDPYITLDTMRMMKEALGKEDQKPFLMCQALGFMTPDTKTNYGWCDIAEYAYGKLLLILHNNEQR